MTSEEYAAASAALMTGSDTTNAIKALGTIPTINFPVLIKLERKITS